MQIERLELTQIRAFEQSEFIFQPGMNLIVGINGVGKSTALDAIRFMLAQVMPRFTSARTTTLDFSVEDIAVGHDALTAELTFAATGINFHYLIFRPREHYVTDEERIGEVREQAIVQLERRELQPSERDIPARLRQADEQPIAVYFSSHRSMANMTAARGAAAVGGQAAAFADALDTRRLRLRQFADWWLAQEALAQEDNQTPSHHLMVLQEALSRFLDGYTNLRAVRLPGKVPQATLFIDKAGLSLDVRQLSDGERSMVALVLDVARRLAQANPKLDDPLRDGQGVILIDELDLHLHPRWQRTIVAKLEQTFPQCQLIATTHSPQIIGEVSPDNIILLEDGKQPQRPDQALGMDSNWILRHLMGTDERESDVKDELARIAVMIEDEHYDEATLAIDELRDRLGDFPELVRLQVRIDRIRILSELDEE